MKQSAKRADNVGVGCIACCVFFFQAEDGIRDSSVTGVQTCALPIWGPQELRCWGESTQARSRAQSRDLELQRGRSEEVIRMGKLRLRHLDPWSLTIILLTFVLFTVALFNKGFTHEVLLEAGVFLVSVKLILLTHKNSVLGETLSQRLDRIQESLSRIEDPSRNK